jgi:ATP-binding cassette subfamily F protein 3
MLTFSHLSLRRGSKQLLENASFQVNPGQCVGLTGANGTGKSSLFAMIRGELQADEGDFTMPSGWVIAHVKQETPSSNQTALNYALEGDVEYTRIQRDLQDAEGERLAELHANLEAIDGYTAESRSASLLQGLGFKNSELQRPVSDFSGGWRMRLNLAQALMSRSDLLLLDEPTNHLDLDAVIWLQDWLQQYEGTMLLISHDREFLDATVKHIAHIEHGSIKLYSGNYSSFENQRVEQLAQQQAAYEKQQREMAHMQSYIDRFRAKATKAKQAQSRLKMLQRMDVISAAHVDSPFHFRFEEPEKLPEHLFQARHVNLGYGTVNILSNIDFHLQAGSRIGLIGPNGAGKSTLIKFLAGELAEQSGDVVRSQHLKISYFAQHQLDQLHPEDSALEHMQRLDSKAGEQSLRNYLGGFGFSNERIEEPVKPFSGGEKARLVLAILVYQRPNVLLLDEPTNHLDLEMRHALSVALQGFNGALVVVSHDRHLLKTVTDDLILVNAGKADPFMGDLDDYANWLKQEKQSQTKTEKSASHDVVSTGLSKKEKRQQDAEKRKRLQPLKKAVDKLEAQMETLEKRRNDIEERLGDTALYSDEKKTELQALLQEKGQLDNEWETLEMEWLEASEAYEEAANAD